MFGSPVLEVILALAGAYAGLGLVCASVCEWLSAWRRWRPQLLETGLRALLKDARGQDGRKLVEQFFQAPLIQPLGPAPPAGDGTVVVAGPGRDGPSHVPPRAFTITVMELIQPPEWQGEPLTFNDFARIVECLPDTDFKKALQALSRASCHDVDLVRRNLDAWFEQVMDRVSYLYRRRLWATALAVSTLVCCGLGFDTLSMVGVVWGESLRRNDSRPPVVIATSSAPAAPELAGAAIVKDEPAPHVVVSDHAPGLTAPWIPATAPGSRSTSARGFRGLDLGQLVPHLLGLLLSSIAVAISAPLAFDLLNRITNVRLGSPPPTIHKGAKPAETPRRPLAATPPVGNEEITSKHLQLKRKGPQALEIDF